MIYIIIVAIIVFTETKIKKYIEEKKQFGEKEEIFNGRIIINKHHNAGMFLNFLEDKKEIVLTISGIMLGGLLLLFAIMLPKKGNKLFKLGLSFLLGGAISNVTDRTKKGYVVDYFSPSFLKNIVFNISDICIFLGSIIITISSLFKNNKV